MPDWVAALVVALPVASLMAGMQLINNQYPNTWFFFRPSKCKAFFAYCLLWGVVAFVLAVSFDALVANEIVTVKGLRLESSWTRALIAGLTAKALVQISFFDVTYGARTLAVGPSIPLQFVEPLLLKKIKQAEASELRLYVKPRAQEYDDLADVKERIKAAPSDLEGPEHLALGEEIDDAQTVEMAFEKHVKLLGRKSFDATFPRR